MAALKQRVVVNQCAAANRHTSTVPTSLQGANPAAWMLDVVGGPQAVLPGYTNLAEYYQASKCSKVGAGSVLVFR